MSLFFEFRNNLHGIILSVCAIFVFVVAFVLFDEFRDVLFYSLEMVILLNSFNSICNIFMAVLDRVIILLNIIPYSFGGNL